MSMPNGRLDAIGSLFAKWNQPIGQDTEQDISQKISGQCLTFVFFGGSSNAGGTGDANGSNSYSFVRTDDDNDDNDDDDDNRSVRGEYFVSALRALRKIMLLLVRVICVENT